MRLAVCMVGHVHEPSGDGPGLDGWKCGFPYTDGGHCYLRAQPLTDVEAAAWRLSGAYPVESSWRLADALACRSARWR